MARTCVPLKMMTATIMVGAYRRAMLVSQLPFTYDAPLDAE